MKKKGLVLLSMLMAVTASGLAQDYDLDVTVEGTWASKYIWRGFDIYDDKAAFQPSATVGFWDSGFSATVWYSTPAAGGVNTGQFAVNEDDWLNYALTYTGSAMEGDAWEMDYSVSYVYYDFPDAASHEADFQEVNGAFAWPELIGGGLTPTYQAVYIWDADNDRIVNAPYVGITGATDGWLHIPGMTYDMAVPGFMTNADEQIFTWSAQAVYNDGALGADHDWSHILWGVSTTFVDPWLGGRFTPALYYQTSMDDSVNTEDELFTMLSYSYSF